MRRRLPHPAWDYVRDFRPHRWDATWIERPRLWVSAVALALAMPKSVCDPACGDGSVVATAHRISNIDLAILGDISPDTIDLIGPMPFRTVRHVRDATQTLTELGAVDAIVFTEFLEHIEDPDAMLRLAAQKTPWLVASSPIVADGNDPVEQHLWAFDMDGYEHMLRDNGWIPTFYSRVGCEDHPYVNGFQVWGARRA